jgi:LmbE family N-acetylglucosaminyl deacetylase
MRWIYLSPHLDDAIFSAGGGIHEQTQRGIPTEIWTIMSGCPNNIHLTDFAKGLHKQWGVNSAEESLKIRRLENERAARIVGAKTTYFDFIDSMYRCGPQGQSLYDSSFAQPHKSDLYLPEKIAKSISADLNEEDILVCPLAIGGHIDHVIVRKAAELLNRSLLYMADIPYLLNNPRILWTKTLGMKKIFLPVSDLNLKVWLEAIQVFTSQIQMEFTSIEIMREKISAYCNSYKGIRFWKVRRSKGL